MRNRLQLSTALIIASLALPILFTTAVASAAPNCRDLMRDPYLDVPWSRADLTLAANKHQQLTSDLRAIVAREGLEARGFLTLSQALEILDDQDLPLYGRILTETVNLAAGKTQPGRLSTFREALSKVLIDHNYSQNVVNSRLSMYDGAGKKNWRAILGDLELAEVREMFYGRDIRNPSPDSLLGKYLAQTGAKTRLMALPKTQNSPELGPTKLVVAVSAATFEAFQSIILSSSHFMTVVGHAAVIHKGMFYGHGGGKSGIRQTGVGVPFPILMVKTSEAQRLNRYMELAASPAHSGWYTALKQPWSLNGYCARGGYSCCTHWIGNIPIGDRLVTSYTFPPSEYGAGPKVPATQELRPYAGSADLQNVWKVPGNEQLADVIGQREANLVGEMASPGWVIQTLLGRTTADRVPLVFMMTADHTAPIPDRPQFVFEMPR